MIDRAVFSLPGVRGVLAMLVACDLCRALAVAGQAWGLASAVVALWGGEPLADQLGWLALFLCCFVLRQVFVYVQDARMERYAAQQADDLRQQLLQAVFCDGSAARGRGTGATSALVIEGVEQVKTYLHLILPKTTAVVVIPLVLLVWIVPLDWVSGLIAAVMFPFIILYMVILGHTAQDEAARRHAAFERLSNHFIDSLRGIDTLKLFGRSRAHGQEVFDVSERFREATMKTLRVATLSSAVLDLFATGALAAVSIMLGFRLMDGSLALFPGLFVLIVVPEFFKPVCEFAADYHASLDGKNSLAAIRDVIEGRGAEGAPALEEGAADGEAAAPAAPAQDNAPAQDAAPPAAPVIASLVEWGPSSTIELRGVDFAYPDYQALTDVSFALKGFSKVGVVGVSGAGKSTLAQLVGGFLEPTGGEVVVDGEPVEGLARPDWRRQVLFIPQDPYLFHASLRDNLAFYTPDASDERIDRAVRAVGLEQLVEELPEGLDTLIGEGARALSGGQAQRIALARALLDDARRVLVFDEPTAHLDIETELELKERMLPLMEGRLVVFATHRLHWLAQMDLVVVLDGGRVVEAGALDDLLARDGALCRLVERMGGGVR